MKPNKNVFKQNFTVNPRLSISMFKKYIKYNDIVFLSELCIIVECIYKKLCICNVTLLFSSNLCFMFLLVF